MISDKLTIASRYVTVFCFLVMSAGVLVAQQQPLHDNSFEWVYLHDGSLTYEADAEGNRIPDFSYAGYRNGMSVPAIEVLERNFGLPVLTLPEPDPRSPTAGIQELIDQACMLNERSARHHRAVHSQPSYLPEEKYRAIVRLGSGPYELHEPVEIQCDGVILQGDGTTELIGMRKSVEHDTIGRSPRHQFNHVILVGSMTWHSWSQFAMDKEAMAGAGHFVAEGRIPMNTRTFRLAGGASAAAEFSPGDNVAIVAPCTQDWIDDRLMGGVYQRTGFPHSEYEALEWSCDEDAHPRHRRFNFRYNRYVIDVDGDELTIDAPVFDHLTSTVENPVYIAKLDPSPQPVSHVGLAGFVVTIDHDSDGETCIEHISHFEYLCHEAHTRSGILLMNAENSWVRDVTVKHFIHAGIMTDQAARITIERTRAIEPVSEIDGGRRYHFNLGTGSQLVLVKDSVAEDARHAFVTNGYNISGNVFLNNTARRSLTASEGHQAWSHGILWDNHVEEEVIDHPALPRVVMALYNRHAWGSHGWATAQSVVWNADLGGGRLFLQKPPLAMNWAIGVRGASHHSECGNVHVASQAPFRACVPGHFSSSLSERQPRSLYEAQLSEKTQLDAAHGR